MITLTVFFDGQFYVGLFEREEDGKYSAARVIFGAEPKDGEIYEYVLKHFYVLQFSPQIAAKAQTLSANPKRMQRLARRANEEKPLGTKAQLALKALREEKKTNRKERNNMLVQAEKEKKRLLRIQKQKERHRGK